MTAPLTVKDNVVQFPARKATPRAAKGLSADDRVTRLVEEAAAHWNSPILRRRSDRIRALCEDEERIKAAVLKHGSIIAGDAGGCDMMAPVLDLGDLAHLAGIVRSLSPKQLEAWLACGERIVAGMPPAEAEKLMWRELTAAGQA